MIRINLLPVRAFKKRAAIKKQATIYFAAVIALVVLLSLVYTTRSGVVAGLRSERDTLAAQKTKLDNELKEIETLEAEKASLQAKLQAIADLETKRKGPVRILDEVSLRIPENRALLINLNQEAEQLTLKGMAMDNETIALFMSNLEESDFFADVELVRSTEQILEKRRIKGFSITCTIVLGTEKPAEGEAAGQGAAPGAGPQG